jgi:hypothetical protein
MLQQILMEDEGWETDLSSNARREVLEANSRLSLVAVLTARPRRLVSVHLALCHQLIV